MTERPPKLTRAKRLAVALMLFAATMAIRADDPALLIEYSLRDAALPAAVSAAGTVVVGNLASAGTFYWMPTTGVVFIGGSQAADVSSDGRTIVGTARDTRGVRQAAIWLRATEWQLLGAPRPDIVPCDDLLSVANATSDDGRVIVGLARTGTASNPCGGATQAFRWEASTGMVDLGSSVSGRTSVANGVSGDGKVVVGYQDDAAGQSMGARWVNGRQELIPPSPGNLSGFVGPAHAANHDGSIVVGEICHYAGSTIAALQSAWIWTARDGTQCLPAPQPLPSPGPPVLVKAFATSQDGRVVVGRHGVGSSDTDAVIWIDRTPHYLKDYLRANGVPDAFQRWFKTGELTDVTPDGRILVGNGAPIGGFNGYVVILGEEP